MKTVNEVIELLNIYINKAHGDGFDAIEIPIDTAREFIIALEKNQDEISRINEIEKKMDLMSEMAQRVMEKIDRLE